MSTKRSLSLCVSLLLTALLIACALPQSEPPAGRFPTVSHVMISPITLDEIGSDFALAPDGNSVLLLGLFQYELSTGEEDDSLKHYQGEYVISEGGNFGWSPDGRYIAVTTMELDYQKKDVGDRPVYLLDTQAQTVRRLAGVSSLEQWSPVNSDRLFAESSEGPLWDVSSNTGIASWGPVDIRSATELAGNGRYLWDAELNVPIGWAYSKSIQDSSGQETGQIEVGISSVFAPYDESKAIWIPVLSLPSTQRHDSPIFDPTGRYLLLTLVEPLLDGSATAPTPDLNTENQNITDSVLLLVDWRTQEQTELFRLSLVDPAQVVIEEIAWSADGSTIVISRKDASAVVLKITYS